MAASSLTPNGRFRIDFLGHVQTEQLLVENFTKLDAILGPVEGGETPDPVNLVVLPAALTVDDIGKVIGVVDDGDGNPVFGLVSLI